MRALHARQISGFNHMTTSKAAAAKWRERNRERIRLNLRAWRAANPDKVAAINLRRAEKLKRAKEAQQNATEVHV